MIEQNTQKSNELTCFDCNEPIEAGTTFTNFTKLSFHPACGNFFFNIIKRYIDNLDELETRELIMELEDKFKI